jgi:hypothetical protein
MHASTMPRIRLARRRQTPALSARNEVHWAAPAISKRAMATKAKPKAFHLFFVVASSAPIPTKISISSS